MKPGKYLSFILLASMGFCSSPLSAQVINTFAGSGIGGYAGDNGPAWLAAFNRCSGVSFDGAGNVYIADKNNNVIRKINSLGIVTTFAGNDTAGYSGDGGSAISAKLSAPCAVATDAAGNVYIADNGNNVIRIVDVAGTINTYAGNDTAGYTGDGLSADHASLNSPQGIALDAAGNLYIADAMNHVIRRVDAGGIINTIAGNGSYGFSGNGGAAVDAALSNPSGVALDAAGNLYIADLNNNVVRKMDMTTGDINAFAGNHTAGSGGDGAAATAAQLSFPSSVSVDNAGSIYITDQGNNTVRRVDSLGVISLFAGNHTNGYTGDGLAPTSAKLNSPTSVAADGWGKIYIADNGNNVIRAVTYGVAAVSPLPATAAGIKVFPNPSTGVFTLQLPQTGNAATVTVLDVLGCIVATKSVDNSIQTTTIDVAKMPAGSYLLQVSTASKTYKEKLVIAD